MTWVFDPLPKGAFSVCVIDPPWYFAAGTKSRPQHYARMSFADIAALPVRKLLKPEGGRVFLWITAPLLDRVPQIAAAWGLRYSTAIPWIKLWPKEGGMFLFRDSFARGTGFEVAGNAEYVAILKAGKPQSIKGKPFPGLIVAPRTQHSRKPSELADHIERRIAGPYVEVFARQSREGWATWGNERDKFDGVAA